MALLKVLTGSQPGHLLPLQGDTAILGRHPGCDIVLESAAVSRQHARIVRSNGNYYVEDLRSRNGTFVNGERVRGRRLLAENDQLGICDLVFAFQLSPAELQDAAIGRGEPATAELVDDEMAGSGSTVMSKVSVFAGSSSLQLQVNPEAKLKALVQISQRLGRALRLNEVLPTLLDSLFSIFIQADRGFIVLADPETGRLVPKAVKHRRDEAGGTIRISRTIVNSVMASKEAILSADAASDIRFKMAESIVDFQIRSFMCAPLINSEGAALGVIQVDTLNRRGRFSQDDLEVLASVACQAAFAVENAQLHEAAMRQQALERDLSLAHEVQRGLLPASSPEIEPYEFFEFYEPANELGGDYYDYVQLPDGRLAVVVADVSGKGISAALLMARLSAETRFCLASAPTPAAAIGRLNRTFFGSGWEDRFVTLVLCVLDPVQHELTIVNAGHLPPLWRHGPANVEAVAEAESRLPLGVDANVTYPQCTIALAPGESILLYTDGITEAMNAADELYGSERLRKQFAAHSGPFSELEGRILDDVKRFVGNRPQSDDMCLLCVGRKSEGVGVNSAAKP
jgi:phosphoserine phosphatase RsbU/P